MQVMKRTIGERTVSYIRYLFFEKNATKFRPGALKTFMDFLFIVFEKVGYSFKFVIRDYIASYEAIVLKEIQLGSVSSKDTVLVIGGGSIPATALILADTAKAQCVVLDTDAKAVQHAITCVTNLDFQDKISIEVGDGAKYKVDGFDVIFVLYGVKNHTSVLQHLAKNITSQVRVIFRVIDDPESKMPDTTLLSGLFSVKDVVKTTVFGPMCSYLLLKKE
jgi:protein-L-isoaspartate O-methyltransferase